MVAYQKKVQAKGTVKEIQLTNLVLKRGRRGAEIRRRGRNRMATAMRKGTYSEIDHGHQNRSIQYE
jgi:hypothetical protein